jgi:serine protease Do
VQRAYLGVGIQPVTQQLAEQLHAKVHTGVLVTEVRDGTPAAKAGLKPGDIILRFAGKPVSSPRELQGVVEEARIGSSQSLSVLRDGKEMTLSVTCREMPADFTAASMGSAVEPGKSESSRFEKLGIEVEDLTPQLAEHLGVKAEHGVAITDVRAGSPADQAGLASGMVITQANSRAVKSVGDLRKALEAKPLDQGVLLLVRSPAGSRFVVIRVESE